MDIQELRVIAQQIVNESKATSRVDQGTLKRSISYTVKRDEIIFREMNYGQYGDNSELMENAKKYMPYGSKYRFELIDVNGDIVETTKTKSGRTSIRKSLRQLSKTSTTNATALINKIRRLNEKKDSKTDNKK
jgi:hypothetical protein